jgi:putative nucleotidyltransferase with HDIG domain
VAAIDAKDPYTKNHSYRVARYVVAIAKELGWSDTDVEGIYMAGLLHDVGKIVISDAILKTEKSLTPEEISEMKRHPELSYKILSKIRFPWKDVVNTVRHHHERVDGKGYPDAFDSESLSDSVKILTLADSFDAMTTNRPYRGKMELRRVIEELKRCTTTQFDPAIMAAFCSVLEKEIGGELPEPGILPHLEVEFDPDDIKSMLEAIREELAA